MDQFATYSKYYSTDDAAFLIELLKKNDIPYEMNSEKNLLDKVYIGESLDPMFELRIRRDQFANVNKLLEQKASQDFSRPGFTHYLDDFSIDELKNVLHEDDSWSAYDVQIAKLLLQQKGVIVPTHANTLKEDFLGERVKTDWLVLGYILALMWGIGLFVGWSLVYARKTMPDGHSVLMYDDYSRKHGRYLIIIGVLAIVIYVIRIIM